MLHAAEAQRRALLAGKLPTGTEEATELVLQPAKDAVAFFEKYHKDSFLHGLALVKLAAVYVYIYLSIYLSIYLYVYMFIHLMRCSRVVLMCS